MTNVIPLRKDLPDPRALDGRYRCIVQLRGSPVVVVLDPEHLSPSGEFIHFGDFHSDELRGWYRVRDVEVLEVLAKISVVHPAPRPPWWKRLFS